MFEKSEKITREHMNVIVRKRILKFIVNSFLSRTHALLDALKFGFYRRRFPRIRGSRKALGKFRINGRKFYLYRAMIKNFPREVKKFTVLRSPHANIRSREQFELRRYRYALSVIIFKKPYLSHRFLAKKSLVRLVSRFSQSSCDICQQVVATYLYRYNVGSINCLRMEAKKRFD